MKQQVELNEILANKTDLSDLSTLAMCYLKQNDNQSAEVILAHIKRIAGLEHVDVQICIDNHYPYVRYTSGLTVYDEALISGRWVGRYWSGDGKVIAETHIWETLNDTIVTVPLHAFCLEIDGQSLHTFWKWDCAVQYYDQNTGRSTSLSNLCTCYGRLRLKSIPC